MKEEILNTAMLQCWNKCINNGKKNVDILLNKSTSMFDNILIWWIVIVF